MNFTMIGGVRKEFDFTVVALPDTQHYSAWFPRIFQAQTRWVADNAARENIAFLTHLGDLVEHGNNSGEWDVAVSAMQTLVGTVPFGVVSGNHDYDVFKDPRAPMENYRRRFGQEMFARVPTTRGFGPDDTSSYHIFRASGQAILSLHLEHDPRDATLAWAERVLRRYPPHIPVMVTTHTYLNDATNNRDITPDCRADGNSPESVFQKFIARHPRIFLVQCGHWWKSGGEALRIPVNNYGSRVIELLSDYQGRARGGDGWLRLLRFDLKNHLLYVQTYSPTLDRFETDYNSEMTLPLNLRHPIGFRPGSMSGPSPYPRQRPLPPI